MLDYDARLAWDRSIAPGSMSGLLAVTLPGGELRQSAVPPYISVPSPMQLFCYTLLEVTHALDARSSFISLVARLQSLPICYPRHPPSSTATTHLLLVSLPTHSWGMAVAATKVQVATVIWVGTCSDPVAAAVAVNRTLTHPAAAGVISPREFIDLATTLKAPNGDITHCAFSITHPDFGPSKGFVRGTNSPCGMQFVMRESLICGAKRLAGNIFLEAV